jgi:hypothetical protein
MNHPEHLTNHCKKWKKNQSIKDAIQDANAQPIISAVEHVPVSLSVRYTNVERETVWEDRDVAQGSVTESQHSEVATQKNMDSIVNDGGANSLITLATTGLMDLAAATAAATSAEEALRLQQTRNTPKKCKVNRCPAPCTLSWGLFTGFFLIWETENSQ